MRILNWCYQARESIDQKQEIDRQLFAAHQYRNKLCELELARRKAAEQTVRRLHPGFDRAIHVCEQAQSELDDAYSQIKAMRAKARKRLPPTAEQTAAINAAKKARKQASIARSDLSKQAYRLLAEHQQPIRDEVCRRVMRDSVGGKVINPATVKQMIYQASLEDLYKASLDAGERDYYHASKHARENSNVCWGTYLFVEDCCKGFREGAPPFFKRYEGHGSIAVQLQNGLSAKNAIECNDTRLQVDLNLGIVRLRIGSDGRKPVWATIPVKFHRPLPSDAVIQWAYLDRSQLGAHAKWKLRLTLKTELHKQDPAPMSGNSVAVHLGYRIVESGLRVATWVGSDGQEGELILKQDYRSTVKTNRVLGGFAKSAELESVRDSQWVQVHSCFVDWLDSLANVPDWVSQETKHICQWKGPERLARFVQKWNSNRFEGDDVPSSLFDGLSLWLKRRSCQEVDRRSFHWADASERSLNNNPIELSTPFGVMEYWRRWDKHLSEWSVNQSRDMSVWRDQYYRVFTRLLRSKYDTCFMAKVDWGDLAEKEDTDEEVTQTSGQRRNGRIASPGRMQELLMERFQSDCLMLIPEGITSTCNKCGSNEMFDRSQLSRKCSCCGTTEDQDRNACLNTLARGELVKGGNVENSGDLIVKKKAARKTSKKRNVLLVENA